MIVSVAEFVGKSINGFISLYFNVALMGYDTITELLSKKGRASISRNQLVGQILFTGVDAIPVIFLISVSLGVIISVQIMANMPNIGAGEYFGKIMSIAIVRELGPFFTSLVVIGRSGSALAAYIGNMKINKEIDALNIMGISVINFMVLPALLGMLFSLFSLNVFFDIFAIVGGLFIASFSMDVNFTSLLTEVYLALEAKDILIFIFKSIIFSSVIATVSCYFGLEVQNVRMVPRAVFRAVVLALVTTIILNLLITLLFYAL
jgi:phospholipid/cholesterol/gamma-HCH transport system permease protein